MDDSADSRSHRIRRVGSIYVADSAVIAGDVTFGRDCNIWHHCVIRGDVAPIHLGDRVNIQDGSLLHCKHDVPLVIANDVALGHHAIVHCTSIGTRTLIGTRATILDDCEVGEDCLIAAGSLLPPGTIVPSGKVVMGVPGKVVRDIRDEERTYVKYVIETYQRLSREHAEGKYPKYGDGIEPSQT